MKPEQIEAWPAKTRAAPGDIAQCCACHMIDVAAVAEVLLRRQRLGAALCDALTLLVALHDIGKVSDSFRNMLLEGVPQSCRHWQLSEALFYLNDDLLAAALGGEPRRRQLLYGAVVGHHGAPSDLRLGPLGGWRRRS